MKTPYQLPQGYSVRPAVENDLDQIAAMLNVCSLVEVGVEDQSAQEMREEWETPGFDPETDTWLVLAPDGQIAAYLEVWDISEEHATPNVYGRVHPDHHNRGIGRFLMERGEERARQIITQAPPDARAILKYFAVSTNEPAQRLAEAMGYDEVRNFVRMKIDMETPPPAPVWPDGITVRAAAVPGPDDRAVYEAVDEAFEDHWGHVTTQFEQWIHLMTTFEDFDPTVWFLAMDGDQIAGMSLCRPKLAEDPGIAWLSTLGVRRPWRRQGLGLALLQHTFGEFYRRGTRSVALGVDAQSLTGATRLYERAGMHVVRRFILYEKELRPGRDLTTRTLEAEATQPA
jgi:mycothiol synthase